MTPRSSLLRTASLALLAVVAVVVVLAVASGRQGPGLWDRRPEYTALHTADELRERPDLAEVLPGHVAATRAVLEAVAETASVTWEDADAGVVVAEREGTGEQVVDGYPVLRWEPEPWDSVETVDLDEDMVDALGQAVRDALEPLGFTVSTANRGGGVFARVLTVSGSDVHGGYVELLDLDDGSLRVIARSSTHVFRGEGTCEPLACRPTVEDPAAGL